MKKHISILKLFGLIACLLGAQHSNAAVVQVTANISGNVTWRATNEYVLNGFIYVLGTGVLNIEAGTVIKGKPGTDANTSCLIVTRGGKMFAQGTRTKPIIFTAEIDDVEFPDDLGLFDRGLWGGVVLLGRTTLNTTVDAAGNAASPKYEVFEGLPDTQVAGQFVNRFGGNDDNDSSGVMRYVSIRHAGVVFQPNKELNGLSLGAVGRGTTLEYIETYATADDGFEFFGGTVNTKYLVSAFNDDDAFDIDQGFRGKNQFWFAIQERGRKDHGGEWNGEPNGAAVGNNPIANYEIYNATWIGAGTNTTGNRGILAREYAAPEVYNSILTEFAGNAVTYDTRAAIHLTNGLSDFRNNIFWNFATNGVSVNLHGSAEAQVLFTDASRSNLNVNPLLRSISRTNNFRLDPRPSAASPALANAKAAPNDGFYSAVDYKGAFDSEDLWINDWTFLYDAGFLPQRAANTIQVTANISGNVTWRSTNAYVLNGFIYVLAGATLTIEPGTVIKGKPGTDANTSCLIVTRGGKIFANGTFHNPIIFTAEIDDITLPDDMGLFDRGLWGGVVLLGRTTLNTTVDAAGNAANPKYEVFEGLPDTQIAGQFVNRFGGSDDNDSSGVMRYVSIRHAGVVFQPNKELNGLSLGGVGRGTTLEFIEAYATADDGFEFFGGTVNTKYLVSAFNDDDAFDIDQGFRGKNQFWFAIQERGRKDHGGEWNGEPNGAAVGNNPIANYEIYNATWIGAGTNTTGNRGILAREYAAPEVYNSILTEFAGNAVTYDTRAAIHLTNGLSDFRNNIFWNFATNGVPVNLHGSAEAQVLFTDASRSNRNVNPLLRGIGRTNNLLLDPRPTVGSPALSGARATPNDGFYSAAPYQGAFDDTLNWAGNWSALAEMCVLTGAGVGIPSTVILVEPGCIATDLEIVRNGGNVTISFQSVTGASYQIESKSSLNAAGGWGNEGSPIAGTGGVVSSPPIASGTGTKYFRVVCN